MTEYLYGRGKTKHIAVDSRGRGTLCNSPSGHWMKTEPVKMAELRLGIRGPRSSSRGPQDDDRAERRMAELRALPVCKACAGRLAACLMASGGAYPPTHPRAGSNPVRQCAEVGHVKAHPNLGCGDVGCEQAHEEKP